MQNNKTNQLSASKSSKSILNAFFAFLRMFLISAFGLIVTRLYLKAYGSDFNGLSSSASQFLSAIMLLEGGITIASNVALFKPFEEKDYNSINSIMSATKNRFLKMSLVLLVVGLLAAVAYSFIINSKLNYWLIFIYLVLTVLTAFFNISISMKYRVVLQTDQKEYVISIATMIPSIIGYSVIILLVSKGISPFYIPIVIFFYNLSEYLIIAIYTKRKYATINYNAVPNYSLIKGTGDVFVLKVTSALFSAFPIIFLSFFSTAMASVYAIYNMVFNVIKNAISVFSQAPRLSFGAIFSNKGKKEDEIYNLFKLYQIVVSIVSFALITVTCILMIPFLHLFVSDVSDANYINEIYVPLFALIALISSLHIPSGQILLMSGHFKINKIFQLVSAGILIFCVPILTILLQITGLLIGVLIASLFLCVAETIYAYKKIFNKNANFFIFNLSLNMILCVLVIISVKFINFNISNYFNFFLHGLVLTIVIFLLIIAFDFIFWRKEMLQVCKYIKSFFKGFSK